MTTIGFIGGGVMATTIGTAIISNDIFKPANMWVSGPNIESLTHWKKLGVNTTTKNSEIVNKCDIIFLCVKPNILNVAVLEAGESCNKSNRLFVSVLAGTNIATLKNRLASFPGSRIIRVMPNTPSLLGVGACVFSPDVSATKEDIEIVEKILNCSGIYKQISENMITAFGALSGSGPAFIYLIIEAMSDGGVKQGIPRETATMFAAQTVLGAAKMVLDSGKHPGQLKDEVCSPGGTTICGIHELEKGGVRASMMSAIEAAFEKSCSIEKKHS